ncbi:cell division protein FtsZ [Jannaschia aquimarina]|uniref:Cell division protein FtsZ n=1 Tax=Jannaschia aquimarina TaxID=935700 RepID=A0A0D1EDS7_9RHOB|nr:cell division protein FtsZ [Jannaschia aquimarina]KIT15829.1 Cell division protein FtsZ [Jannaschia aquimarina]SNT09553.1 cell division protein FtsZ [Jannaschia aquimarina]
MTLNLSMPGGAPEHDLRPRITVFGVGGAGGNAVNNMIQKDLEGVEFVVANTDAQALQQNQAQARIQLGARVTEGLGAGARPEVGASAAEETIEEIVDRLAGAHMCFITAGMGGGTGTGAAPIIAQAARELGILTVGVVTKPFAFEGAKRMRQAEEGAEALQKVVDTLIIIPNQNLFRLANEKTTFTEAFQLADDVLYQGVKGVTDLMVRPGMINLDFADVRSVMDEMGKAMMGTGEATGEDRAQVAAEKAIANPLLDELSLNGAKGVLINITGGYDLTLFEMDEAANVIREQVDTDANIIVGSTLDPEMEGSMRVSVVATGIDATAENAAPAPMPRRRLSEPTAPVEVQTAAATAIASEPEVVAEPAPEPEEVFAREEAPAASFFDAMEAQAAEEESAADDFFGRPAEPTYEAPRPSAPLQAAEPTAPAFVTARPAAGTPTPEAIARLRAAVEKGAASRPAETPAEPPRTGDARFGISSLINRMTGSADTAPQRVEPRAAEPASTVDPDEERIEIPAFLRRQAN